MIQPEREHKPPLHDRGSVLPKASLRRMSMWTAESKGLARGRGARRGRSRPWGPRPWQADATASPRVGRHTESQGKRLLFVTLITLTDGPWPSAKAPGVPSPGAGPQQGAGVGVLPRFSTHFCPNYLHYSAMSAFSAPSLKDAGQAWSSVRGAGPWPLHTSAPGRGGPGCWKSQAWASPP